MRCASSATCRSRVALNESPSQKEGKSVVFLNGDGAVITLNESPSQKEGKSRAGASRTSPSPAPLNESPSQKEGKFSTQGLTANLLHPSMKVPPKRKGNPRPVRNGFSAMSPSMKVPPKRKGNARVG